MEVSRCRGISTPCVSVPARPQCRGRGLQPAGSTVRYSDPNEPLLASWLSPGSLCPRVCCDPPLPGKLPRTPLPACFPLPRAPELVTLSAMSIHPNCCCRTRRGSNQAETRRNHTRLRQKSIFWNENEYGWIVSGSISSSCTCAPAAVIPTPWSILPAAAAVRSCRR